MTKATARRIARLYERVVGYDPEADGWTMPEALDSLRWIRTALFFCPDDAPSYVGPTMTKAQMRACIA
jgi:hypothetical protein